MNKTLKISDVLKDLGVPASILGYRYLKYAVELALEDISCVDGITKKLYPDIAKYFKTTAARVERAIRHAVDVGWLRGNVETQRKLFGYTVSAERGRPTNCEFIATIADYLTMVGAEVGYGS